MNRNILNVQQIQKSEIEAIRFLRGTTAQTIEPFVGSDSSVGMEYELQVAVEGSHDEVDLPITILDSNYYKNIVKRAGRGDLPVGAVDDLNTFIYENGSKVWENSWVRFEKKHLTAWTQSLLTHDLLADKKQPEGEQRQDTRRFIYSFGALAGSYMFLQGAFTQALLFTMMLTQLWRILSETMRADFRGFSKISTYQKMGLISVLYMVTVCFFVDAPPQIVPEITTGLHILWTPGIIVGLQVLWLVFFFTFGRSTVTTSTVSFELIKENI